MATEEGACKTRSLRKRIEDERLDSTEIGKVVGTPWKPYLHSEDDKLLSRAPQPALEKTDVEDQRTRESDESVVPCSFAMLRKDLDYHGYTQGCQGCYAAAKDRKHKPHIPAYRERIAKALMSSDKESHIIKDANDREDAFLENSVRQGDLRQTKRKKSLRKQLQKIRV